MNDSSLNGNIILDNPQRHARLDRSGMHDAIAAFPVHLRESVRISETVDWSSQKPTTPAGICICGMGGSAIGGDLARSYWERETPVPMVVVRDYRLPRFINDHWFVIASSYSGNTEETLSAADDAAKRRCRRILALTSGGRLAALAAARRWPLLRLPAGLMPRAALGYSFGAIMMTLARWGVVGNNPSESAVRMREMIDRTAAFLEERRAHLDRDCPQSDNPAKTLAAALKGRVIVVWGAAGTTDVVAARIKCQLCENAKAVAFAGTLTEVNHNEVVGLDAWADAPDRLAVLLLESEDDSAPLKAQSRAVADILSRRGIHLQHLNAHGRDRFERLLSLVQMGDFVSYHLAIATGHDPTPIRVIEDLKAVLAVRP